MPRRIGIITSPRGAAIRDILNILCRRHESVHLLIFPAQVQGTAAPLEVAAGLRHFNRAGDVEVIIIARGGGSAEDLAAFNDEDLARAIAASKIPVISAIGHETDFTIADFVADLRAPTPSAAAELVIESKQRIEERVRSLRDRLSRAVRYRLVLLKGRLTELAQHASMVRISDLLNRRQQRLDELSYRMAATATGRLHGFRRRLENAQARLRAHDLRRVLAASNRQLQSNQLRLDSGIRHLLAARHARLERLQASLDALSPLRILDRGYALVFDAQGNLVKDSSQLSAGDELTARFARGSVMAEVKQRRTES
jgi:exodeoxyribonuclease VII large subunit